jgi:ERF superfamily protein
MEEILDNTSILRKLHAVMKDVDYIQKDKTNAFHKYNYASEAAIKEKVHAALVEHGVVPQFDLVSLTERTGLGKEGKDTLTTALVHYRFSCVDTGQCVEGSFYGCGTDPADKGLYKAITGAIKYILTSQFLIPTGDDPENEAPEPRSKKEIALPAGAENSKFKMLEAFQAIKADLKKLTGDDKEYYAVLGLFGYERSNHIPDVEKARPVYKALKEELEARMETITQ